MFDRSNEKQLFFKTHVLCVCIELLSPRYRTSLTQLSIIKPLSSLKSLFNVYGALITDTWQLYWRKLENARKRETIHIFFDRFCAWPVIVWWLFCVTVDFCLSSFADNRWLGTDNRKEEEQRSQKISFLWSRRPLKGGERERDWGERVTFSNETSF